MLHTKFYTLVNGHRHQGKSPKGMCVWCQMILRITSVTPTTPSQGVALLAIVAKIVFHNVKVWHGFMSEFIHKW